MKAGIATSNGRAMVDTVLDSLGIRRYFQVVATAQRGGGSGKPAPDTIWECGRAAGRQARKEMSGVQRTFRRASRPEKRAGMTVFAVEGTVPGICGEEKAALAGLLYQRYCEMLGLSEEEEA